MLPPVVPFTFSLFTVSVVISKVIRLAAYVHTVPLASFLLLFPTFWIFDISAICILRLLLWHQARGLLASVAFCFGLVITYLTLIGAACQVGFYIKTGTELDWSDAPAFLGNKNSIVVLLSGSWRVLASASFILTLAYFTHQPLYRGFGAINSSIALQVRHVAQWLHVSSRSAFAKTQKHKLDDYEAAKLLAHETDFTEGQGAQQCSRIDEPSSPYRNHGFVQSKSTYGGFVPLLWLVAKVALLIVLAAGCAFRPSRPYLHMSTTLPASLADIMHSSHDYCTERHAILENEWPLPGLIDKSKWQRPAGRFKGWAPGPDSDLAQSYRDWTPSWMPKIVPRGFSRWNPMRLKNNHPRHWPPEHEPPGHGPPGHGPPGHGPHGHGPHGHGPHGHGPPGRCGEVPLRDTAYSPVNDPLRISNLDTDILEPIKEALDEGSVKIKHVVYILMESLRSEFFPLQQGSDIHEAILSLSAEEDRALMNERLSRLTPNTERITGVKGSFVDEAGLPFPEAELKWQDPVDDQHGGINVVGAYTSASMSTKSFAANHCGAWPMPVDTFDEAATDSYQPCMPQILNLWSDLKNDEASHSGDFRDHKWYPALFESMVETYDRQEIFDRKVGFKHIMTREQLEQEPDFDRSKPKYQKVNYFGFPEQVLKPHIKDYIRETIANDQRIWMTHFTSTTHHAWKTPDWFNTTDYMPTGLLSGHRYLNRYLNTIRFNDLWMAELMQLLEDTGIANETLVVFAGDHGMAFHEDDGMEGTYGNAHVSNLRVPISFRHPHLPRVQYHANATTISTLPTILDLLIHSGSLNKEDKAIASDLVNEYEGQSLIRPYKTSENGRRAWNFAVINPGGKMLAVTSADAPWKLVIPFGQAFPYSFSDISTDPLELNPTLSWTIEDVMQRAEDEHGLEAGTWAQEAELVGKWWSTERKRLWRHHSKHSLP